MRRFSALIACAAACAFTVAASAATVPAAGATAQPSIPALTLVKIADALPKVRAVRAEHPGSRVQVFTYSAGSSDEVKYLARSEPIAVVIINRFSGQVLEEWTGIQAQYELGER